ncbi:MAG: PaaI family thioesterase [Anaerolineaceae bacterium]
MKKQPGSKDCFVCGVENLYGLKMKFYEDEDDGIYSEMVIPERFQGYPGVVHGGIIASMLDEVSGRAFMTGDDHQFFVTAELKIRYRKPVPIGQILILKGRKGPDGGRKGRIAFGIGEIWNTTGALLASADILLVEAPETIKQNFEEQSDGWKIYPD